MGIAEFRVIEGFGARWSISGDLFRGFLEPQMEDGHLKRINLFYIMIIINWGNVNFGIHNVGWRH